MHIRLSILAFLLSGALSAQVALPTDAIVLDKKLNHTYLAYPVGSDTLKIRRLNDSLVFPLAQYRRLNKDSTWQPSDKERDWLDSSLHVMAQNCFSYAFEWSFIEVTNGPNPWFSSASAVMGPSTEWLLSYAYDQVSEGKPRRLRRMQRGLPNKAYLLFRDQRGRPLHAAYYLDEIIYSKNGGKPPRAYLKLKELIKHYPDTRTVEVYRLKESTLEWKLFAND